MKNNVITKTLKFVFIFLFVFLSMSFFFSVMGGDVLWNYGFSYALSKGEIPYIDFNMIIPPLYPFIISLFFRIFSHNILVFYIVNSLLITYMFYLLFKLYDYKAYFLLIFLFFPLPAVIFPSYNLYLIFLVVLLLYLEKNNSNDYLIGFILGLGILTKHTVGIFLCFPSFYYLFKEHKKLLKRIIGCFIPCFIFLIYLIINKSLLEFLDLCFFGMFDFAKGNGSFFNIFFFMTLFLIICLLKRIIKNPSDISNYYIFSFSIITIPLFDINHFLYFLFVFLFSILNEIKFKRDEFFYCGLSFTLVYIFLFFYFAVGFKITFPNHYKNFESRLMYNSNGEFLIRDRLNKYIKDNKNYNIIILSSEAYFYKITNEMPITSFDLINKGNNGYNSTKKIIDKLNNISSNSLIIISYDEYEKKDKNGRQQIDKNVMKYVIKNGILVDEFDCFKVYRFK